MDKIEVCIVGAGGVTGTVHLPVLKKICEFHIEKNRCEEIMQAYVSLASSIYPTTDRQFS